MVIPARSFQTSCAGNEISGLCTNVQQILWQFQNLTLEHETVTDTVQSKQNRFITHKNMYKINLCNGHFVLLCHIVTCIKWPETYWFWSASQSVSQRVRLSVSGCVSVTLMNTSTRRQPVRYRTISKTFKVHTKKILCNFSLKSNSSEKLLFAKKSKLISTKSATNHAW